MSEWTDSARLVYDEESVLTMVSVGKVARVQPMNAEVAKDTDCKVVSHKRGKVCRWRRVFRANVLSIRSVASGEWLAQSCLQCMQAFDVL